jgi:hypothetical protein
MKDHAEVTEVLLRQYLLGNVDDEWRQRIESLFLTDSTMRERVLGAEQDLIEDYLEDSLTSADKKRFLLQYAQTPEQQRKLRITKSIKDWAVTEASSTPPIPPKETSRHGLRSWLRMKPVFAVPIAVMIIIAIVVVAIWLTSRNRRLAIEEELAQLNAPESLREVPSKMVSRDLAPGTIRSSEQEIQIKKSDDFKIIELRLQLEQTEPYSQYQVDIGRVADDESFTIRILETENDGRSAVRVRLPSHLLYRGHYLIRLRGITPDGSVGPAKEYTFAVAD